MVTKMFRYRVLYVALLISVLLFRLYYGGALPNVFLMLLVLLPVASFLYSVYVLRSFTYQQTFSKSLIVREDEVDLTITAQNEGLSIYPYVHLNLYDSGVVQGSVSGHENFTLFPDQSTTLFQSVCFNHVGKYSVGIDTVETVDLTGLFKLRSPLKEKKVITVYPQVVGLERFPLDVDFYWGSDPQASTTGEDQSAMSDVRDYQPGDTLKRIHWNQTARTGTLKSKNYESTAGVKSMLIFDPSVPSGEAEARPELWDMITESAVAITLYCLKNNIPVELLCTDNTHTVNERALSMAGFDLMYLHISEIEQAAAPPIADVLHGYLEKSGQYENIIVFTTALNYRLSDFLRLGAFSGHRMTLVYVSETPIRQSEVTADIASTLYAAGVKIHNLVRGENIKTTLEEGVA